MKNKEIIKKLQSVKLCLMGHPDNEKGSEFEDRINDLEDVQSEVKNHVDLADVILNEATSVVAVTGCPYRVQDNCNFIGTCLDENCNIRAKPVNEG